MSDAVLPYSVTLHLNGKRLNAARLEAEVYQRPFLAAMFVLSALGLMGAIGMTIWALFTVDDLALTIRSAQKFLATTMARPSAAAALESTALTELRQLAIFISQFDIKPFQDKIFWLILLGGCMPICVLLVTMYRQRNNVRQPDHMIAVTLGAAGISVRRGATEMHHAWSAVSKVRFKPPPGKAAGNIIVELEYGYFHAWPSQSFSSREEFILTGHQLCAQFLASSTRTGSPSSL